MQNPARWERDPTGVFDHRYWDGVRWTDQVAAGGLTGTSAVDVPVEQAQQLAAAMRRAGGPGGGTSRMPSVAPVTPTTPMPPLPRHDPSSAPVWPSADVQPQPPTTGWTAVPVTRLVVGGRPITGLGRRFGSWLLDILLWFVTLGIGWTVWATVTAAHGQTPAKRLMRMQTVNATTGQPLGWGMYVIVRGGIAFVGNILLSATVVGLLILLMPVFNQRHQHYWGALSNSVVVDV